MGFSFCLRSFGVKVSIGLNPPPLVEDSAMFIFFCVKKEKQTKRNRPCDETLRVALCFSNRAVAVKGIR